MMTGEFAQAQQLQLDETPSPMLRSPTNYLYMFPKQFLICEIEVLYLYQIF